MTHGVKEALGAAHGCDPEPSPTSVARPPASVVLLAPGETPRAPLVSRHFKGRYAVTVTSNWRITFAWEDGDAVQVNFEDYHSR